jgi:AcrR family transcriptional regulator
MTAVDALLAAGGTRLRADAQRNTERLVAAARTALDEQGVDLTTRDIAQRAGVGLGTLYRRIPSLEALLTAILIDTITEMTELAIQARHAQDPGPAFVGFAEAYVQLRTSSCALHAALSGSCNLDIGHHIDQLRQEIGHLIRIAQATGAIRDDLDWRDIPFALAGAIPADHTIGLTARPDQWRRNLGIILDGLRPSPRPTAAAKG